MDPRSGPQDLLSVVLPSTLDLSRWGRGPNLRAGDAGLSPRAARRCGRVYQGLHRRRGPPRPSPAPVRVSAVGRALRASPSTALRRASSFTPRRPGPGPSRQGGAAQDLRDVPETQEGATRPGRSTRLYRKCRKGHRSHGRGSGARAPTKSLHGRLGEL